MGYTASERWADSQVTKMENEKKIVLRDLLGINQASTPVQTASSVIGSLLFGGGLLGALNPNNQQKTYTQATKSSQIAMGQILPGFDKRAGEIQEGLNLDLSGRQAKTEANIRQGLVNRGISDPNIGDSAVAQTQPGISGAYAMARTALAGAKLNARRSVSGALSSYQQALAQKQYESMVSKYYSKMGLWGALGGFGMGLADIDKEKQDIKPDTIPPQRSPIGTDERGSV